MRALREHPRIAAAQIVLAALALATALLVGSALAGDDHDRESRLEKRLAQAIDRQSDLGDHLARTRTELERTETALHQTKSELNRLRLRLAASDVPLVQKLGRREPCNVRSPIPDAPFDEHAPHEQPSARREINRDTMGLFWRTFAAVVAADAIDRHARSRPVKYWYPKPSGPPPAETQVGYPQAVNLHAGSGSTAKLRRSAGWDPQRPERPI